MADDLQAGWKRHGVSPVVVPLLPECNLHTVLHLMEYFALCTFLYFWNNLKARLIIVWILSASCPFFHTSGATKALAGQDHFFINTKVAIFRLGFFTFCCTMSIRLQFLHKFMHSFHFQIGLFLHNVNKLPFSNWTFFTLFLQNVNKVPSVGSIGSFICSVGKS